jgi:Protein of unknown function (DUF3099)
VEREIPDSLVLSGELMHLPDDTAGEVAHTPPAERRDPAVHQITTAAVSLSEDIRRRKRKYLISMGLRTICFIMAIVVRHGPLLYFFIAGALFLPYVAVLIANAGREPNRTPPTLEARSRYRELRAAPEAPEAAKDRVFTPEDEEAATPEAGGPADTGPEDPENAVPADAGRKG